LWPYRLAISAGSSGLDTQDLEAWWNSLTGEAPEKSTRADMVFAVLEALGYKVPATAWQKLLAASERKQVEMPSLAVWRGMIVASQELQTGLGVASALVGLGTGAPGESHPALVSNAILALRSLSLEREARQLSLEALAATD
jgi:hypothetical protein